MPKVSIGMPVYNGENFIEAALRSHREQTFEDWELIICDNASQDATEEIIKDFVSLDPRISYHRNEHNLGANPNYNKSFVLASGQYFRWAAHDDVLTPTYLDGCVRVLDEDPSVVLCHSRTKLIDRRGAPLLQLRDAWVDIDGYIEKLHNEDSTEDGLASDEVSRRVRSVIGGMNTYTEIFGLGRRSAWLNTLLHQAFYGTDRVLLVEMALQGKLERTDDDAFLRRCHAGTSTRQGDDHGFLKEWSQTATSMGSYYPARIFLGYIRAIARADVPLATKLACEAEVLALLKSPLKVALGR
ncbi:MAG: glycosyltransferase [Actinomycetia bacterium]|nr:glycosyltransferase [Actinomycetes bacterium]